MPEQRHHRGSRGDLAYPKRRCPQCGRKLPLTAQYWHHSRSNPGGFAGWCKSCRSEYGRAAYRRNKDRRTTAQSAHSKVRWDSQKRRWTAEEERVLRDEYPATSTADLAAKLRRSQGAVRIRAHELGLHKIRPGTTRPDVWLGAKEIARAYRLGRSQGALARQYGTTAQTIRAILVGEGCSIRGQSHFSRRRRLRIRGELYVQCTKCKRWKPRTHEFFKTEDHSPDGLSAQCRACQRGVERRWIADHPQQHEERRRQNLEYHRRVRRGLWAARWRLAADELLMKEDEGDGQNEGADRTEAVPG